MEADGKGILIRRKDFTKIKEFKNWTDKKFRQMCILSGCDYLDSPPVPFFEFHVSFVLI